MAEDKEIEKLEVLYKAMAIIQENITNMNKGNQLDNQQNNCNNEEKNSIGNNEDIDEDVETSKLGGSIPINNLIKKPTKITKCLICNTNFNHKSSLYYHMQSVHNGIKNFACEICDKTFISNCALTRNKIIHSDEKTISVIFASYHLDIPTI